MASKKYSEEIQRLLKVVVDEYWKEDTEFRQRQLREWRRMRLMWEGFTNIYWSEVAHDWRIWDAANAQDSDVDQAYYDKPVNIFRAYLESIIAALSVTVPPVTAYPDDADSPDDILTAKAADKAAALIYRHNEVPLLWLKALFLYSTEGAIGCYHYAHKDKEYGETQEDVYGEQTEITKVTECPNCAFTFDEEPFNPEAPSIENHLEPLPEMCPQCNQPVTPTQRVETNVFTIITGTKKEAKARICLEAYGGLNLKIPLYARTQKEMPYLFYSYETHYANVLEEYPELKDSKDKITGGFGAYDQYEAWARAPIQYSGNVPASNVTVRKCWLRSAAFNVLDESQAEVLAKEFPNGVKVCLVNDTYADACPELLDDSWTITQNPLANYLQHEPLGLLLVSIQEITNDIISLTLQTMEHGISQTFADPAVLNFSAYKQMEVLPGGIYPASPRSGKGMGESFYEVKTATLSAEVMPFAARIDSLGQLVSGALPSLFGGQMTESRTASEYSMSRAQATQRLQNTWKMFTGWWKVIFAKTIPMYFENLKDDEKWSEKDNHGSFMSVIIRKAETLGKLGRIELEANENIPLNWAQQKDTIMQLLQSQNEQVIGILSHPENLPYLRRAIGLTDLTVPGEDDRDKQYAEILELINSSPLPSQGIDPMTGQEMPEEPSVPIDPDIDNHALEFEVCRAWLVGPLGRDAKTNNPDGYMNVMLHAKQHQMQMQMQMMQQQAPPPENTPDGKTSDGSKEANGNPPITEDADVKSVAQ